MSSKSSIEPWFAAAAQALASGSCASAVSAAVLAWRSKVDESSAAGGLNGPSQWIWGERAARTKRATLKHTVMGFLIHHGTSVFWATFYERLFGVERKGTPAKTIAAAAATAATAYVVDYYLTPPRLQPGFDKHMTGRSMTFVYIAFAVGLAAVTLARKPRTIP